MRVDLFGHYETIQRKIKLCEDVLRVSVAVEHMSSMLCVKSLLLFLKFISSMHIPKNSAGTGGAGTRVLQSPTTFIDTLMTYGTLENKTDINENNFNRQHDCCILLDRITEMFTIAHNTINTFIAEANLPQYGTIMTHSAQVEVVSTSSCLPPAFRTEQSVLKPITSSHILELDIPQDSDDTPI